MIQGSFESLEANSNNIVLGEILARKLNLDLGDKVSLMLPDKNPSFAGYFPRISNFKVSGIFRVGSADLDESIAYIRSPDQGFSFIVSRAKYRSLPSLSSLKPRISGHCTLFNNLPLTVVDGLDFILAR